jgi:ATP-dependent RNA/DNA helicase IGHMBP2
MSKKLEYLNTLTALLELEKQADLEMFKAMVQRLPLQERQSKGFSWYPVEVVKKGYTYGDRAFVTVERTKNIDTPHQFRSGKVVNLFTQQPSVKKPERSGVIHFIKKNRMKIILNSRDLPDWIGLGLIGVDLLFDDTTYLEMAKALHKVKEAKNGRLAELRAVLMGIQEPRYAPVNSPIVIDRLNASQNKAINNILSAQDLSIIHGPPGTGKTTTLVQAIKLLSEREATILVTAPSNTAVDLLTERLAFENINVTRIGNISRVDEAVIRHTLEIKFADHPESKNIKKIKVQAAEARRKAMRYKRNFGYEERQERNRLFKEAGELSSWANQLEGRIIDQILDGSQVITATLVGAANKLLDKRKFRTVIIDEAAQASGTRYMDSHPESIKSSITGRPAISCLPRSNLPKHKRKGFKDTDRTATSCGFRYSATQCTVSDA